MKKQNLFTKLNLPILILTTLISVGPLAMAGNQADIKNTFLQTVGLPVFHQALPGRTTVLADGWSCEDSCILSQDMSKTFEDVQNV